MTRFALYFVGSVGVLMSIFTIAAKLGLDDDTLRQYYSNRNMNSVLLPLR